MPSKTLGAILIGLASMLWATDALFRLPTLKVLNAVVIVWAEHAIGLLALLIWVIAKKKKEIFHLRPMEWIAAIVIGAGGSALATILFTAAFRYLNPSVVILLQKLQPVLVVLLAMAFLRERPRKTFYFWAFFAFLSAIALSFPDFEFGFLLDRLDLRSAGVLFAVSAAMLWALATVAGKALLKRTSPAIATFWRYAFGFFALSGILLFSGQQPEWTAFSDPQILQSLLYMGIVPGLLAMVFYYQGLTRTSASIATFMELLYPIAAIGLNAWLLDMPLGKAQLIAGSFLLFSVTMISIQGPAPVSSTPPAGPAGSRDKISYA